MTDTLRQLHLAANAAENCRCAILIVVKSDGVTVVARRWVGERVMMISHIVSWDALALALADDHLSVIVREVDDRLVEQSRMAEEQLR